MPESHTTSLGEIALAVVNGTTAVPRAVAKLIETVCDQVGLATRPWHTRRQGQAEADLLVANADAGAEIAAIEAKAAVAVQNVHERAAERVRKKEARRQCNIEAIANEAARHVPEAVVDEAVDPDWTANFFEQCQDVSSEQMRTVWAKLLAGEVARPGTFSLRTLAAVKLMNLTDADLFTRFCSMVWFQWQGGPVAVAREKPAGSAPDAVGMWFGELSRLEAIGLIQFNHLTGFGLTTANTAFFFSYGGGQYLAEIQVPAGPGGLNRLELGPALLTAVGAELAPIAGGTPDEKYRAQVVAELDRQGWTMRQVGG
jgi:hypothetical protein